MPLPDSFIFFVLFLPQKQEKKKKICLKSNIEELSLDSPSFEPSNVFKRLDSSNLAFISSFDWIICGLAIKKFGFVRFWVVLSY